MGSKQKGAQKNILTIRAVALDFFAEDIPELARFIDEIDAYIKDDASPSGINEELLRDIPVFQVMRANEAGMRRLFTVAHQVLRERLSDLPALFRELFLERGWVRMANKLTTTPLFISAEFHKEHALFLHSLCARLGTAVLDDNEDTDEEEIALGTLEQAIFMLDEYFPTSTQ